MTGKEETGIFTLYSDVEATAVRWLWYKAGRMRGSTWEAVP